jgi:UDP-N-acetylmuramate: L-alanyl-gamma-D-glutamyl-meso-diaminopimelate ligase
VRTVPGEGLIVVNAADENLTAVLEQGCWTAQQSFSLTRNKADWQIASEHSQESGFAVTLNGNPIGNGSLGLPGEHNLLNALAAIAAARHAGVRPEEAIVALQEFRGVRRRLEVINRIGEVTLYDDFAHHPTAIAATLSTLRNLAGSGRVLALLEPRSNTMRLGVHNKQLRQALADADLVWVYQADGVAPGLEQELEGVATLCSDLDQMLDEINQQAKGGDHIVLMSNGGFGNARVKLPRILQQGGRQ